MKYIYAAVVALCATTGYGYETLVPVTTRVIQVQPQPVVVQTMVYYAPYFTVTVPVPVAVPVAVAQPVQSTYYWGYPYQPVPVTNYWYYNRCRLFNY